ncbi:iron chelate uptake ABC transporter family permease subunit [Actinophytocola sp. NPDC049390]|uniref:iron chelate uptake ABC transporter family permease subunit n=1 Tax=Actinophytocola sp. NPDC049390 TaxID=3363894 RepID=UPI003799F04A
MLLPSLSSTVLGLVAASLLVGAKGIPPATVLDAVPHFDPTRTDHLFVHDERLPRTVLAVLFGAALGLAGMVMLAVARDPLAEPGVLGVNAGATGLGDVDADRRVHGPDAGRHPDRGGRESQQRAGGHPPVRPPATRREEPTGVERGNGRDPRGPVHRLVEREPAAAGEPGEDRVEPCRVGRRVRHRRGLHIAARLAEHVDGVPGTAADTGRIAGAEVRGVGSGTPSGDPAGMPARPALADPESHALLSTAAGLASAVLIGLHTPEEATTLIDYRLAALFDG